MQPQSSIQYSLAFFYNFDKVLLYYKQTHGQQIHSRASDTTAKHRMASVELEN